eukprot:GFYU01021370.1.p1 GENE.GFYU01021370.1~~GFYU01021370.1.p1  ORF type:complete len:233 (+),score=16.56 GFYU01021370.1:29-700(+)
MAWRERTSMASRRDDAGGVDVVECKVIMVGTVAVGKTSLTSRYVKDTFRSTVATTIGASYMWRKEVYDDITLKFSLWDTAGQEQFHALVPMYFREADAVVLVVDATSNTCVQEAEMWLDKVRQNAPEGTTIFLALNKVDLRDRRVFSYDEAEEFCRNHPEYDIQCGDVSAKTGEGVHKAFHSLGERCLRKLAQRQQPKRGESTINFSQKKTESPEGDKKKCPC